MSLTFDEATHTYRFGGQVVPGVTSILAPLSDFSRVPPATLEAASQFGRAVHLACELDDLGELDEAALDPALRPYLQAWREFSREYGVVWAGIEERLYHPTLRYAGTADRIGEVAGRYAVVDIKSTAALYPAVGPQLAAYAHAANKPSADRIAVQLKADGTYVAKPHNGASDFAVFAGLLTVRNWCAQHAVDPQFTAFTHLN